MKRLSVRLLGVSVIALVICSEITAGGRKPPRLTQGSWGGQHITMDVGESSAAIEFDCANGQISGPLTIDRRGRFDLKGTFTREHGGPIRDDEKSNRQPARYSGWTDGRRMTLTVTTEGQNATVGAFNLTHANSGP